MSSYRELNAQLTVLEQQIKVAREAELATIIEQVRDLVATWQLRPEDVFGQRAAHPRKIPIGDGRFGPMPPKYRDPATGATWSGRGRAPLWIAGKDRAGFAI